MKRKTPEPWDEEAVREEIKVVFKDRDDSHGFQHALDVKEGVEHIMRCHYPGMRQDLKRNIKVVAYGHDVADDKYLASHPDAVAQQTAFLEKHLLSMSAVRAQMVIKRASWSDEQRQLATQGKRDWEDVLSRPEIEMRHILSDADKLEAINEHGLGRCLAYTRLIKPVATQEELFLHVQLHAQEKLFRIRDYLHSPTAVKLGREYHARLLAEMSLLKPEISEHELSKLASGLNIEGGSPAKQLREGVPWANLVMVLDHIHSGPNFDALEKQRKEAKFPLLENLLDIDEHKMFATFLTVINFYCKRLGKGTPREGEREGEGQTEAKVKILGIHIHQFPEASKYIQEQLENLLAFVEWSWWDRKRVKIVFFHDSPTWTTTSVDYSSLDSLISFSQCAGFDVKDKVGSFVVPSRWIPWDLGTRTIDTTKAYSVRNELSSPEFAAQCFDLNPDTEAITRLVAERYVSANPGKATFKFGHADLSLLQTGSEELRKVTLLQVDKIWNPSELPVKLVQ